MAENSSRLLELYDRWFAKTASEAEVMEFYDLLDQVENANELDTTMKRLWLERHDDQLFDVNHQQQMVDLMLEKYPVHQEDSMPPVAHRVHFLRRSWFRYAAAILIIFGSAAYLWTTRDKTEQTLVSDNKQLQDDILPGGEKAVLTLADGTKIILDNAANGNLVQQGNARVVKLSNGQIAYNLKGQSDKKALWNTMSTPAGGQYQVILPDGTKVWLNAASSITYPTVFIGKNRSVKISGEVYFEVSKNKSQPFLVDVDGKSVVEVLGTSFNINSYADEKNIKTTLIEGSVKMTIVDRSVILKPGQQATSGETISVKSNVDMVQALAWKNGLFNFNGSDLKSVMRQLERWYDIKVRYEGSVSNDVFKGKMYRNVKLSDVLRALQKMGVKFRLDGKTLIVEET